MTKLNNDNVRDLIELKKELIRLRDGYRDVQALCAYIPILESMTNELIEDQECTKKAKSYIATFRQKPYYFKLKNMYEGIGMKRVTFDAKRKKNTWTKEDIEAFKAFKDREDALRKAAN